MSNIHLFFGTHEERNDLSCHGALQEELNYVCIPDITQTQIQRSVQIITLNLIRTFEQLFNDFTKTFSGLSQDSQNFPRTFSELTY